MDILFCIGFIIILVVDLFLLYSIYENICFSLEDKRKTINITFWAEQNNTPDFNKRRWIMIGKANKFNYICTRLFFPKSNEIFKNKKYPL